jgi:hypothetical protein
MGMDSFTKKVTMLVGPKDMKFVGFRKVECMEFQAGGL